SRPDDLAPAEKLATRRIAAPVAGGALLTGSSALLDEKPLQLRPLLKLGVEPTGLAPAAGPCLAWIVGIGVLGCNCTPLAAAPTEDIGQFESGVRDHRLDFLPQLCTVAILGADLGLSHLQLELLQLPQRHSIQLFCHHNAFPFCTPILVLHLYNLMANNRLRRQYESLCWLASQDTAFDFTLGSIP